MTIQLGDIARDTISGFQGVVTSAHSYLNGCNRFGVQPKKLDDKGQPVQTMIFDEQQLELVEAMNKPAATPAGGPERELPAEREH